MPHLLSWKSVVIFFYAVLAPSFNSIRTSPLFVTVGKATFRPGICIVTCWIGDNNDILTLGPCI